MWKTNQHFFACQNSEKRKSPCMDVVSVFSCWEVAKPTGVQRRLVQPWKEKYMVTFSFMFLNRRCNQQLPAVTFWEMDLLTIAKWLLSPTFCVPTGLCICLPWIRKKQWLIEFESWQKQELIRQVKSCHWLWTKSLDRYSPNFYLSSPLRLLVQQERKVCYC